MKSQSQSRAIIDGETPALDISQLHQLESVAKALVTSITHPAWVYLQGALGLGKTTFCQFFIAHKGYQYSVTSPTYALIQDYQTTTGTVIHGDLYRLAAAEELYETGLLDIASEQAAIVLIEWPEKGKGVLPDPDITLSFSHGQTPAERFLQIKGRAVDAFKVN